jgi:hypothetical protein
MVMSHEGQYSPRVVGTKGALEVYRELLEVGGVYIPLTDTGFDCIIKSADKHIDIEIKSRTRGKTHNIFL